MPARSVQRFAEVFTERSRQAVILGKKSDNIAESRHFRGFTPRHAFSHFVRERLAIGLAYASVSVTDSCRFDLQHLLLAQVVQG